MTVLRIRVGLPPLKQRSRWRGGCVSALRSLTFSFLFYTFTSPHPTLLPILSNVFLILQNSDGFVVLFCFYLPIAADNPGNICREMQ